MQVMFSIAFVGGLAAICLYFLTFCAFKECLVFVPDEAKWGQAGDFFGGVLNPFFTFVGLIFVIKTIQQNQQALKHNEDSLKLSRIELELSRIELEKSSEALQAQVVTAEKQRFETTFFQMFSLLNGVVRELYATNQSYETVEGKACLVYLHRKLINSLANQINASHLNDIAYINSEYDRFYVIEGYILFSYFCLLRSILEFIDSANLSERDKNFYTNLIRSQLSKDELGLLFYELLNSLSKEKTDFVLLVLVKKYNFFHNLKDRSLASPVHRELFDSLLSSAIAD